MLAHPADLAGRDASHKCIGHNVFSDDGASGDEGVFTQCEAADDGGIGADGDALFHQGTPVFALADDGRAGVTDVGEDHAGTAKDVVFQSHGVIDADVVLDLAVIADENIVADEDVLAERATLADTSAGADVDPVPNAGASADLGAIIDDGRWMDHADHRRDLSPFPRERAKRQEQTADILTRIAAVKAGLALVLQR